MDKKLYYLAGIIDGEGHFYMSRSCNSYYARLVIEQKDIQLIEWLKNNYGGTYTLRKRLNGKEIYRWVLQNKPAIKLADKIKGILIVKREQVKRIIPHPYQS